MTIKARVATYLLWLARRIESLAITDTTPVETFLGAISLQMGVWLLMGGYTLPGVMRISWGLAFAVLGATRLSLLIQHEVRGRTAVAFLSCCLWVATVIVLRYVPGDRPGDPIFVSFALASTWILLRLRAMG